MGRVVVACVLADVQCDSCIVQDFADRLGDALEREELFGFVGKLAVHYPVSGEVTEGDTRVCCHSSDGERGWSLNV